MKRASLFGDVFITTTGCKDVIGLNNISNMKDGAILANAGHFNVEIAVAELDKNALKKDPINEHVMMYELSQNKKIP